MVNLEAMRERTITYIDPTGQFSLSDAAEAEDTAFGGRTIGRQKEGVSMIAPVMH